MIRTTLAAVALLGLAACSQPADKGAAASADAATATSTSAPASAPAQSPRAWIESVYAEYRKDENFSPFTHPEQWFDPELLAAIKEDEALTPEGDVGFVDGDPICSCQDASGMNAMVEGVEQTSPTTAVANVKLWANSPDQRPLKVDLVAVGGQWRIHDVTDSANESGQSFLTGLKKANDEARAASH